MGSLPNGWIFVNLDELFNLIYGKGLKVDEFTDDGYDVYGANGIIGKYTEYNYKDSKVLISCRGAASGAIHKTKPFSFVTSNSIVLDEYSANYLNLDFAKYAMSILDKESVITGTAQPQITVQLLKDLQFPLAPLPEQQRIVAKLDTLFARIENTKSRLEKIPQLLKNFRQAVLTQAVTGKLTEEWREGKELEEWKEVKLGNYILEIKAGKNFNCPEMPVVKGKVGLVKISAVTWGKFNEEETKTVEDETRIDARLFIKAGDFLISRANTLELVGASLIVDKIENDIMLSDKIWRVRFEKSIIPFFIDSFLKSSKGRSEIESRAVGNQLSMRNISQNSFKDIDIPLPTLEEQKEMVRRVESLFAKADAIEKQYQTLKQKIDSLPQALLAKAFKGELVEQLESDGSAEELLKEIQKAKAGLTKSTKKLLKNEIDIAAERVVGYGK